MTVWAEFLALEDVEADLAFAGSHGLNVNVAVVRGETTDEYLRAVCETAERHDIGLVWWPVLAREDGYWPNQGNVDVFLPFVDELLDRRDALCPRLDGIVVDMEMPIQRIEMLSEMRESGAPITEIAGWALSGIDVVAFDRARGLFDEAGQRVRARGLRWTVTTLPMNLDDYRDGDQTVAHVMWTPIEGITWDNVSFQVYRSLFDAQFPPESGEPYTAGLVTTYATTAVERWAELAGVDLGTTGSGIGIETGIVSADEMQSDIAAALAAGIEPGRIAIYSLEGLRDKADRSDWVRLPAPRAAPPTATDEGARSTFSLLDSLED